MVLMSLKYAVVQLIALNYNLIKSSFIFIYLNIIYKYSFRQFISIKKYFFPF